VKADLKELEAALGTSFRAQSCCCARSHIVRWPPACASDGGKKSAQADNERLEVSRRRCLGSRCGGGAVHLHPEWREGEMTRIRSGLVSRLHMAQIAEEIDLGRHLRLSRGEERSGLRRRSTVLSNTMEAVMGALFLDGGLEPVRVFVRGRVMGEAAERLAVEMRSGEQWEINKSRSRSGSRPRAQERRSIA